MHHARESDLAPIAAWLEQLRELPGLKERKPGIFYHKSRAFLHFHEDGGKLYADVRLGGDDFDRHRVHTVAERRRLTTQIRQYVT